MDLDRDVVAVEVRPKRDAVAVGEGYVQEVAEEWIERRVRLSRRAAARCAVGVDRDCDIVVVQVGPERGRVAVGQCQVLEVTQDRLERSALIACGVAA